MHFDAAQTTTLVTAIVGVLSAVTALIRSEVANRKTATKVSRPELTSALKAAGKASGTPLPEEWDLPSK